MRGEAPARNRPHARPVTSYRLTAADAQNKGDDLGLVSWTVTIPADAIVGPATFVPDGGQPLTVRVVTE